MGGSQYQAKCIIEALQEFDRYEIVFLTRDHLPNYQPDGYRLERYSFPGARRRGVHRLLFEMMALPKALKRIAPDIIYQRVGCAQTGIAAHYALRNQCKMVWHVAHENDLDPFRLKWSRLFIYRLLDRRLLNFGIRHVTHIITQTEDQKLLLQKNFHRNPSAVIPNFHPEPKESLIKKDPVKIAWVANLKQMKQPEIFIRLATELQALPNTQFIMIGALQEGSRVKHKYVELIGRAQTLNYLGPKSQDEVNAMLAQAHIFVNTSLREGFPNTFIQAWLRQVPVVSMHVDPDRLIDRYRLGFVSGSFDRLKEDVAQLVSDSEMRNRMGAGARNFALEHFSPGNAAKIHQVLDSQG